MPIVDIEFVGERTSDAQSYADRLGIVFGSAPGTTWVRLRSLDSESYAENGPPTDQQPIFVTVLLRRHPNEAALSSLARRVAEVVGDVAGRARTDVHVVFAERGAGRVAFGGNLMSGDAGPETTTEGR